MIGNWDNDNCVFALLPMAEAKFRTEDTYSGYATIYTGPSVITSATATMYNMGPGYGFVYNNGYSYYNFDGDTDQIIVDMVESYLSATNTNEQTYVFWLDASNNASRMLGGLTDGTKRIQAFSTTGSGQLQFLYDNGPTNKYCRQSGSMGTGADHMVVARKTGSLLQIFYDNVEVSYATQNTYNLGDITWGTDFYIGSDNGGGNLNFLGLIRGVICYTRALSTADMTMLYNLGPSLGNLKGIDNGDGTMELRRRNITLF